MLFELLVSVGVISGLSSFLALLMVIADATIANYGEININITDSEDLTVKGGRPLLGSLMGEGIFIPSACGGRGSCGMCKVKLKEKTGDYLPTELPWISEEEKNENIRLSCQFKAKTDLKLEIPEELFNVKEFSARVRSIADLTHDIKQITLELLEPAEIEFRAGQFVQFQVPEYELTDEEVYRAYSVSSNPADKNTVELEIRLVPNGICTTYVHKYLKENDTVTINGPYGEFFLQGTDRDIVFIAGGSGMAPIKAILSDMKTKNIKRRARYFFGALTDRDLFLVEEMKELEKDLYDFKFIPALSKPEDSPGWKGETGLITEVVAKHLNNAANSEAYLCGSPGMIDACVNVLTAAGMPENQVFYDKFA